jgi:hypothetical protein
MSNSSETRLADVLACWFALGMRNRQGVVELRNAAWLAQWGAVWECPRCNIDILGIRMLR